MTLPLHRIAMLFAKEPRGEFVKTRLASAFSPQERWALYTAMLADLLDELRSLPQVRRIVFYAPEHPPQQLLQLAQGIELCPQEGIDLGERMASAFRLALEQGPEPKGAVLIGSDAPLVDRELIEAAFLALRNAEVVLAPAADGGYALIGLRETTKPVLDRLFSGIPWSTGEVYAQTLDRIEAAGLRMAQLPLQVDVDLPEDLAQVWALLRGRRLSGQRTPKRLAALLDRWGRP
ncbi:MAG: hypothetical protein KatS3mg115_1425 [Candidatus Poribacteria bacterium]|nr:MAG: hypothetical protein KatS3mg115_1425 [Candidatus Poribacteria bacterium]